MTNRTSTITLSIADRFSQPLQQYASGTEKAVQATEKLAAAGKQGADAAAKVAKGLDEAAKGHQKAGKAAQKHATQAQAAFNEIQAAERAAREESEARRKAFLEGVTAIRDGLAITAAAVVAFGVAVNKAFEFGKEGAIITQTTESFDRMMQMAGAVPGVLERMRAAARGTVDDLTLMANVQTLLAGTSGDLQTAFANAAPQLLEIAKAANKVNPTLGDTNFLFESIARGIKRSSPLILDNLGIVVKLGPAYEEYAESIGKSVEALSAEEKQVALLNAVLAQGNVLIEQAGGSADSAADSFARAEAAAANWANMTKTQFAPAMGELAREFAESAELAVLLQKAVDRGAMSSFEAQKIMALTTFGLQDAAGWVEKLTKEEEHYQARLRMRSSIGQVVTATTEAGTDANQEYAESIAAVSLAERYHLHYLGIYLEGRKRAEQQAIADAQAQQALADRLTAGFEQMTRHGSDWLENLDALVDRLDRYRAANGAVIPPAENLNDLLLDAAIAGDKFAVTSEHLAEAQRKLSENTDPDKQAALEREVRLAERAVRDAKAAMEESGTTASNASGGIADYSGAISKTTEEIHNLLTEMISGDIVRQMEALAATGDHQGWRAMLDWLKMINPELATQMENSRALSLVTDALNQAQIQRKLTAEEAKPIWDQFNEDIANGVPPTEAMARALQAINAEVAKLPEKKTVTVDVITNHYNRYHDVQVSEPGPPAPNQTVGPPDVPGRPGTGFAAGGHMLVPPGFFGDSYPLRVEQGEEVTVRTARQQREGTNIGTQTNLGGVSINIYQQPGQSARALADEVAAILGSKADLRARRGN